MTAGSSTASGSDCPIGSTVGWLAVGLVGMGSVRGFSATCLGAGFFLGFFSLTAAGSPVTFSLSVFSFFSFLVGTGVGSVRPFATQNLVPNIFFNFSVASAENPPFRSSSTIC